MQLDWRPLPQHSALHCYLKRKSRRKFPPILVDYGINVNILFSFLWIPNNVRRVMNEKEMTNVNAILLRVYIKSPYSL